LALSVASSSDGVSSADSDSDSETKSECLPTFESIGSWSNLRCPHLITPEAFESHRFRVQRQIAAVTGMDLDSVIAQLAEALPERPAADQHFTLRDILRFAEHINVSAYFYNGRRLHTVEVRKNNNKSAIVFACWCRLLYFYKGMGPRARDDAQGRSGKPPRQRESELCKSLRHQPKAVGELQPFPWHLELADVPAGHYWILSVYCHDDGDGDRHIEGLLCRFLLSKRYPRVTKLRYGSSDKPHQLLYHKIPKFDNGAGTITVRSHARDVSTTAAWAKRLDVPYAGQSLGPFTGVVLDALLRRRQRRYLADSEKRLLREQQRNSCSLCGDTLGSDVIFDHAIPLHQMTQEQSLDSFQAICGPRGCGSTQVI
jgi:hypothetical protein